MEQSKLLDGELFGELRAKLAELNIPDKLPVFELIAREGAPAQAYGVSVFSQEAARELEKDETVKLVTTAVTADKAFRTFAGAQLDTADVAYSDSLEQLSKPAPAHARVHGASAQARDCFVDRLHHLLTDVGDTLQTVVTDDTAPKGISLTRSGESPVVLNQSLAEGRNEVKNLLAVYRAAAPVIGRDYVGPKGAAVALLPDPLGASQQLLPVDLLLSSPDANAPTGPSADIPHKASLISAHANSPKRLHDVTQSLAADKVEHLSSRLSVLSEQLGMTESERATMANQAVPLKDDPIRTLTSLASILDLYATDCEASLTTLEASIKLMKLQLQSPGKKPKEEDGVANSAALRKFLKAWDPRQEIAEMHSRYVAVDPQLHLLEELQTTLASLSDEHLEMAKVMHSLEKHEAQVDEQRQMLLSSKDALLELKEVMLNHRSTLDNA